MAKDRLQQILNRPELEAEDRGFYARNYVQACDDITFLLGVLKEKDEKIAALEHKLAVTKECLEIQKKPSNRD